MISSQSALVRLRVLAVQRVTLYLKVGTKPFRLLARRWHAWALRRRWAAAPARRSAGGQGASSFSNIQAFASCNAVYINLEHRADRRQEIEGELVGFRFASLRRLEAYRGTPGAMGCSISHALALASWVENCSDLLMVIEDDCAFVADPDLIEAIVGEFATNPSLDVLALSYRTHSTFEISENLSIASRIYTTACYVLKPHMVSEMLRVAQRSAMLLAQGAPPNRAAIDVLWHELQTRHLFAVPRKRVAIQRASFSDVADQSVNYDSL